MWAAALVALSMLPLRASGVAAQEEQWVQFQADRPSLLNQLAPPFVDCFKRRDSAIDPLSPMFHGCIDWHSAVHAAYSHHVLARRTGDQTFMTLANDQLAPGGVSLASAELAYEMAKGADLPLTENPYGFGWFLILAWEREAMGYQDLRPMADYAARELMMYYLTRTPTQARSLILNEAHPNYSWSLINLDVWAKYTNDEVLKAAVRDAAKPLFDPTLDTGCPATRDRASNRTGFQPACIMRLAAAAHIYGDHVRDWVMARLPAEGMNIAPVSAPANCHAGGLNFARAFALYQLFHVTGDAAYRDNYADLIRYHVGRPDLYIDPSYAGTPGYLCYSHWVAQFGVRSISLSYEPRPAGSALPPSASATAVSIGATSVDASTVHVDGSAAFAEQAFVVSGTDASGDADLPAGAGQDLTSASAAVTPDGRLRLRFQVASLPAAPARPPRVNYGRAFCVSGGSCFEIDTWSVGASTHPEVEVWRCATSSCAPSGQTLTTIPGTAVIDRATNSVNVNLRLDALGAAPGATLTPVSPVDAAVFTGVGQRHGGGDRMATVAPFVVGGRTVSLAVGTPGQSPDAVDYTTTVTPDAGGAFTAQVDASDVPPGPATLYVRACLGPTNCASTTRSITL